MTKDNLEGSVRSAIGQGEKIIGQAVGDKAMAAQGAYDYAAGKAQSALVTPSVQSPSGTRPSRRGKLFTSGSAVKA